jgi:hypothetical protein
LAISWLGTIHSWFTLFAGLRHSVRKRAHMPFELERAAKNGARMDRKLMLEIDPHTAYVADLRIRNAEFCRKMLTAIRRGEERCPTSVDTTPGTKRPILGHVRSD